jgi:hypothetical protein
MSLTFHWFLPTNGGDGRDVVGGATVSEPAPRVDRPACPAWGRSPDPSSPRGRDLDQASAEESSTRVLGPSSTQ